MSTECNNGQKCDIETAKCIHDMCVPINTTQTNVQQMISNTNESEPYNPAPQMWQQLFLSCPKGNVLYDAGMVAQYKGIPNGNINWNTKVVCERHDDQRYWKTEQGGKLFFPSCMSMPGCNCLKGEV